MKKIPMPNKSKPVETGTDRTTGILLQEQEPVTFSASSLDSKLSNISKFQQNPSQQVLLPGSLPENLNTRDVLRQNTEAPHDVAASISAWRKEVAKYQNLGDSSEGGYEGQPPHHDAMASVSWASEKSATFSNESNDATKSKKLSRPPLIMPAHSFTPLSSDGEEGRGSASTVDHDAFKFPPLSVESDPPGMPDTVDFSQPVFQGPQSRSMDAEHHNSNAGLSSQASASRSAPLDRQNLTSFDLFNSNSTITITDTREAILSTSGSLVDIIVLLQRLCGFSGNLIGIILSNDSLLFCKPRVGSLSRLRSKESFSESGDGERKSRKPPSKTSSGSAEALSNPNLTASSGSEAPSSFSGFMSWSTFTSAFSNLPSEDAMDIKPDRRESHDFPMPDPRHRVVRTPSRAGPAPLKPFQEEQDTQARPFNKLKSKLRLHLQVLRVSDTFFFLSPHTFSSLSVLIPPYKKLIH